MGTESHDEPIDLALLSLTKKHTCSASFSCKLAFTQLFSLLSFPKSHVGVPLIPPKVLCSAFLFFGLTGHGGSEHYQGQGEAWCSQGALHVLWRVLSLLKCENGEFFCKDSWARHVAWWSRDGSDGIRTGHTEPMWSPRRLKSKPRRNRPMPNRSHGTMAKSEKAHINAEEEKTDAEQVPWNQSIVRVGSHRSRGDAWCSRGALHVLWWVSFPFCSC